MKRKVNLVGSNTLTVSLPSQWVKENKIRKGDELGVLLKGDNLVISKSEEIKKRKGIKIDVSDYHTYIELSRYLTVLYKLGYNKIVLKHSKGWPPLISSRREKLNLKSAIRVIVNRFIGAEIVSQDDKKTEIKCFLREEKPDVDKIAKRVHFLLKEALKELVDSIGPRFKEFYDMAYEHHDTITKFINYYFRALYKSDKPEDEKRFDFALYTTIEILVDKIRYLSRKLMKGGQTHKVRRYLKEIFDLFFEQCEYLHSKTPLPEEYIRKRYNLKDKVRKEKFTAKECAIVNEALFFIGTITSFSESILVKNLNKKE